MNARKNDPHNTPALSKHRRRRKRCRHPLFIKSVLSIFTFTVTLAAASRLPYLKSSHLLQSLARSPHQVLKSAGKAALFSWDNTKNTASGNSDPAYEKQPSDTDGSKPADTAGGNEGQTSDASGQTAAFDSDFYPDRDLNADHDLHADNSFNSENDVHSGHGSNSSNGIYSGNSFHSDNGVHSSQDKNAAKSSSTDKNTSGSDNHADDNENTYKESEKNAVSDSGKKYFSSDRPDSAENAGSVTEKGAGSASKPDSSGQIWYPKDSGQKQPQDQEASTHPDTDTQWIFFSESDSGSQILSGSKRLQTQSGDTDTDESDIEHIQYDARDWNLILVNPWNSLPQDYEIRLSSLPGGHSIDSRCYSALMKMLDDCSALGYSPLICSSYRTEEKQKSLFQERIDELTAQGYSAKEARVKAASSVARPGTSEHQLGLAVDIVDKNRQMLDTAQENTPVQQWLMKNSWKYGFILRYPQDKSSLTGIIYEPWHYRYVGVQAAAEIYERGICLEEYIEEILMQ